MGKPKKGKSSRNAEIDSDGEVDLDPIAKALKEINEADTGTKAGGKKGKKKKKDVDELFDELVVMDGENDIPEDLKEPEEEVSAAKGKKYSTVCLPSSHWRFVLELLSYGVEMVDKENHTCSSTDCAPQSPSHQPQVPMYSGRGRGRGSFDS